MRPLRIRNVVLSLTALLLSTAGVRAGTVVSGPVEGAWDLPGSPYWVEGDLTVAAGTALSVAPGVEVRFRGPYRLLVNGSLVAAGTETDSIRFTRDEPTVEWRGIRLVGAEPGARLEYCRIEFVRAADAYPEVRGGAIYCESCAPKVAHCLLQHNISHNANQNGMGGGVACVSAAAVIEFCVIRDNQADSGGGICAIETGADAVIRGNRIEGNTAPYCGGGIYAGVRSGPVIENNEVIANTAYGWGGGGITLWNWYAAYPVSKVVRNNLVAANHTTASGGGFYIRYDFSELENNTVVDNTASGSGGGVYVLNQGAGDFPPLLRNWIVWGNAAPLGPGIRPDPSTGSVAYASYCDIQGGWTGTGNIDLPPDFAGANYGLDPSSPCIDAGDPAPAYDDACFPPSLGGTRNDMGAYGGPGACGWPAPPVSVQPGPWAFHGGESGSLEAFPNPFRASTELRVMNPSSAPVRLTLYDLRGRAVRSLAAGSGATEGSVATIWDGRDDAGRPVPAGIYLVRAGGAPDRRGLRVVRLR